MMRGPPYSDVDELIKESEQLLQPPSMPETSRTYALLALAKAIDNYAKCMKQELPR